MRHQGPVCRAPLQRPVLLLLACPRLRPARKPAARRLLVARVHRACRTRRRAPCRASSKARWSAWLRPWRGRLLCPSLARKLLRPLPSAARRLAVQELRLLVAVHRLRKSARRARSVLPQTADPSAPARASTRSVAPWSPTRVAELVAPSGLRHPRSVEIRRIKASAALLRAIPQAVPGVAVRTVLLAARAVEAAAVAALTDLRRIKAVSALRKIPARSAVPLRSSTAALLRSNTAHRLHSNTALLLRSSSTAGRPSKTSRSR